MKKILKFKKNGDIKNQLNEKKIDKKSFKKKKNRDLKKKKEYKINVLKFNNEKNKKNCFEENVKNKKELNNKKEKIINVKDENKLCTNVKFEQNQKLNKEKKIFKKEPSYEEDERFQFNDKLWLEVKKEESKRGIIYLSHIPIGLTPSKIKEIFSKYGSIDKIYLNKIKDEKINIVSKEKNSKRIKYSDGYIEFYDKKDAIKVEKLLNNQMIGGKKRKNILRENFWHIKYLKNFTWNDLVSSVLYRNISRKDRFNFALKNMYKNYEKYLEKNIDKEGYNKKTVSSKFISKKNKKEKKKSPSKNSNKLKFVTLKEEDKKTDKSNTVSSDFLKLLIQ
ncbi:small subunit rRNA processing protein, putative [Plasmodium gallinaceum]|uniref:Small subunit rRNA processing protein, putative n=1 Tax=Plasmodium gallinaceum TaxID=5849 RepID=A0A1J1GL95_PLAGA|nr:small subunit rRNA processing protein, putative [Plasmodium gallinaceum]CRG93129.1 small subunit rRNA processing protein, putative [Plasmodium gallinaceum]